MTPALILTCVLVYSAVLLIVTWITSRHADNESYFLGNKASPWYVIAYGMIGASLSGVTFMSVPGWVNATQFSYMFVVFGYFIGYIVIATVLMPLYYRLNLTSIYSYLQQRFGFWSYKTGAFFFLLSRTIGASFRLYLVVNVLQTFVFDNYGIPFILTVACFIGLILLYTYKGGIKTIIWTDTLQTTCMLVAVGITIYIISKQLNLGVGGLIDTIVDSSYSKMIFTEWQDKRYFLKQLLSGVFIAIVMTGLDQEMMQKNLSCKHIKDAQKNMLTFSTVLVFVNLMFLCMGAILYVYCNTKGITIPAKSDDLFPQLALKSLGGFAGMVFIIGLISAAYPSADGALTSLTTSFCVDFLELKDRRDMSEQKKIITRKIVHLSFSVLLLLVIVVFRAINDSAVVGKLFTVAGYTYGPLLGLYSFGLFTKHQVKDRFVPYICVLSPILCYLLSENSERLLGGYKFSFELLILNGALTFIGLLMLKVSNRKVLITSP